MSAKQAKPNLYDLFLEHKEKVESHMARIEQFIAAQPPKCDAQNKIVADHNSSLYHPDSGLVRRVTVMETRAEADREDTERRFNMKLAVVSGLFAIVSAAIGLLTLLK